MSQRPPDVLRVAIEMSGKHEGPAVFGGQLCAFVAGAQQKALRRLNRLWRCAQAGLCIIVQIGI
ncbi:hypothetical protein D3C76_1692180 [compost metagenome]